MIEKRTTLILGAGSSAPYGFPTGKQLLYNVQDRLVGRIETLFSGSDDLTGIKEEYLEKAKEFREKVIDLNPESIDLFISRWPSYEEIGKISILIELIEAEKAANLRLNSQGAWYHTLMHKLTDGIASEKDLHKLESNQLAVITFNYDRTFEYRLRYLFHNFIETSNKSYLDNCFRKVEIIHVYGSIGDPFNEKDPSYFKFGGNYDAATLNKLSKNVKIIYSEREKESQSRIKEILKSSERILFLGFGYNQTNLEAIGYENVIKDGLLNGAPIEIYGTAKGETQERINEVLSRVKLGTYIEGRYTGVEATILDCDVNSMILDVL